MKIISKYFFALIFVLSIPGALSAQSASAQQNLILHVNELNKIDLTNPSVYLVIEQVPEQGETVTASNADGSLLWTTNGENRKITVTSNQTSSKFTLKVMAENISRRAGTAGPEITLNDQQDHNFILGVSRTAGSCILRLTAISSLSEGITSETRVLTYTIMNN